MDTSRAIADDPACGLAALVNSLETKMRLMMATMLMGFVMIAGGPVFADDFNIVMPKDQIVALQAVLDGRNAYATCGNPLKCSALRKTRDKAVSKATDKGRLVEWYGVIKTLSTTGDGDAFLTIAAIGQDVTFGTWNNSLSDINTGSLIASGSPLYEALSEMSEGEAVAFSGQIKGEKSVTEAGAMNAPDFLVKFKEVRRVTAADAVAAD